MKDPPSRTLEKRLVSAGAAECAGEPECSRTSSVCTSPICSGADGRFSRRGGEGGSLQAFWDGRAACREAFLSVLEGESVRRPLSSGGSSAAATRRRRRSRSSAPAEGVPDVRMAASSCLAQPVEKTLPPALIEAAEKNAKKRKRHWRALAASAVSFVLVLVVSLYAGLVVFAPANNKGEH